jgi:predicted phosphoadenosine phosphosulfate sulfurtransferase
MVDQLVKSYVKLWENRCYHEGIPDEADSRLEAMGLVPSYKRICMAILKNDNNLHSLGFTPKYSNYYSVLKRIELGLPKKPIQLKLF